MADIAVAFHWPPQVMDEMDLETLAQWRERARVRVMPEETD